jgi:hypothetical protein
MRGGTPLMLYRAGPRLSGELGALALPLKHMANPHKLRLQIAQHDLYPLDGVDARQ